MVTAPTRTLLLYAQDHKGLGHITRTLTIARQLLAAYPDAVAYVATESPITRDVALGLAPDLVLVDHEPLGHKGEFSDGLSALKAHSPGTKFVFGLRDIMD